MISEQRPVFILQLRIGLDQLQRAVAVVSGTVATPAGRQGEQSVNCRTGGSIAEQWLAAVEAGRWKTQE